MKPLFFATTLLALVNANANAAPVTTAENNTLTNLSDTDRYQNAQTEAKPGLGAPLQFQCGVHGERSVDGRETRPTTP